MLNLCYVFVKIQENAGGDREIRGNIPSNAGRSENTEAGVYKSEAFMPAGVNKSDSIISCVIARSVSDEAIS